MFAIAGGIILAVVGLILGGCILSFMICLMQTKGFWALVGIAGFCAVMAHIS